MHTQMVSDALMVFPAVSEAAMKARSDWPVFFYLLAHFNDAHFPANSSCKGMHCIFRSTVCGVCLGN